MARGLCRDCNLRVNGICDQWGEDPTCQKWVSDKHEHKPPEPRFSEKQGTYPVGTKHWEKRG